METQHTTGSWKYNKQDSNMYSVDGSRSTPVAMVNPFNRDWLSDEEVEANAKLIAAAPELLEVLQRLEKATHNYINGTDSGENLIMYLGVQKHALRVIKKATE